MALYEYRCRECKVRWTSEEYGLDEDATHLCDGWLSSSNPPRLGTIARVYSFSFHREFQPHYNMSVGAPVSSKRQLENDLRRKSEEATARTGVLHDYRHADPRDRDIFPVTHEGLDSTYNAHDPSSPVRRAIESV